MAAPGAVAGPARPQLELGRWSLRTGRLFGIGALSGSTIGLGLLLRGFRLSDFGLSGFVVASDLGLRLRWCLRVTGRCSSRRLTAMVRASSAICAASRAVGHDGVRVHLARVHILRL